MKNRIWVVFFALVFLASCQSSRFMQDDMYFNTTDAKREVRQFEVTQQEKQYATLNKNLPVENNQASDVALINTDDYYDYSYSSRLKRFNDPDNSWAYYDPYYTNYYWFDDSRNQYFGNSIYSTYSWWGPNFGNNYDSSWQNDQSKTAKNTKGWTNPWKNNTEKNGWLNPYNTCFYNGWNSPSQHVGISWNNRFSFDNMYYNSLDNNCYWWWWKKPGSSHAINFAALMQKNGISKDVVQRPEINYTALRENQQAVAIDTTILVNNHVEVTTNNNQTLSDRNRNTNKNDNNKSSVNTNSTNKTTTNTYKTWDNHNADVNISPNSKSKNTNWSRSGVFSEGSRNNNYEYKGSTMPDKKKKTDSNGEKKNKDKAPQLK
jgi:hypothetical protein